MILNHSDDEEGTAYHEAGHAVEGALCDRAPHWVTVIAVDGVAGRTEFPKDWLREYTGHSGDWPEKRLYIETRILTGVAGTIAHDMRCPERAHDAGDEYDEKCAWAIMEDHAGWADGDRDGYFQQLQERARGLLLANWRWVEAVARALIERKTLKREEVMELRPS
jgi:hypothetical protein